MRRQDVMMGEPDGDPSDSSSSSDFSGSSGSHASFADEDYHISSNCSLKRRRSQDENMHQRLKRKMILKPIPLTKYNGERILTYS